MKDEKTSQGRVFQRAFSRINQIHKQIASGRHPTVSDLSELCGVSTRTIKRDLDVLRNELNAPLNNDRRRGGFFYSNSEWTLPIHRLTEGDLLAFFIAENALQLTGQTPEALQLKKALTKLASLLPDEVSINLTALATI